MKSDVGCCVNCLCERHCSQYLSLARRTPSLSTRSGLSRRPAVSLNSTGNPPMSSAVSTTSLVVPAMGDTMAAGLWPDGKKVANDQLLQSTA